MIQDIVEVKEIVSEMDNSASWEIGELISDGWITLAYIYKKDEGHYLSVLGRPSNILHIPRTKRKMGIPVITSGRYSEACIEGTPCQVKGCNNPADYEVMLYDYYSESNGVYFKRHHGCGFMCEAHMQENETNADDKIREPRRFVSYPYNIIPYHVSGGYIKYLPSKLKAGK